MLRIFILLTLFLFSTLYADAIRPIYVDIHEQSSNSFDVFLKVPAKGEKRLVVDVAFPKNCQTSTQKKAHFIKGAYVERWRVTCSEALAAKTIHMRGLQSTNTDLLLRLQLIDGSSQSSILKPAHPYYEVLETPSSTQVAKTYTWLGITHILMGYDHLMFVFALLLIVKSMRRLLVTITAFTLAHSITLAGATLGLVHVPQAPVEAVIALSILFLAVEIMHEEEGAPPSLTARYPWVVAFIFGLLHGFGFAGALTEVGVPQNAITIALIFFNVGVEIGQLLFVSTVVLVGMALHTLHKPIWVEKGKVLTVYIIGIFSTFWLIERVSVF